MTTTQTGGENWARATEIVQRFRNGYAKSEHGYDPEKALIEAIALAIELPPVIGTAPLSGDGRLVGLEADVWATVKGRTIRFRTAPVITCYLDGIEGSALYELHPRDCYFTHEAAEAALERPEA